MSDTDFQAGLSGERLRGLRLERGLSQRELGELADVSSSTISRLEGTGAAPSSPVLEALGQALGVVVGPTDEATEADPDVRFGRQLREWRIDKGLTQAELAESVGIDPTYISKIERGRLEHTPSVRTLRGFARALDVDELDVAAAANKLGPGYPIFLSDTGAVDFFRAVTTQARSSADWERLTNIVQEYDK